MARFRKTVPGELAERQPDCLVQGAVGSERRDSDPDALLIRGHEIPDRVVRVGDITISGDGGGPPAGRADEVVDQRADVPRRARRRRVQILGLDLGQDGQGALEGLVQWAFHHLRSSPAWSAFNHADLAGAEKESLRTLWPAAEFGMNARPGAGVPAVGRSDADQRRPTALARPNIGLRHLFCGTWDGRGCWSVGRIGGGRKANAALVRYWIRQLPARRRRYPNPGSLRPDPASDFSRSLRLRADGCYLCELALERLGRAIAPAVSHGR